MDEILCCVCEKFFPRNDYTFSAGYLDVVSHKVCDYCMEEYISDPKAIRPFSNWLDNRLFEMKVLKKEKNR